MSSIAVNADGFVEFVTSTTVCEFFNRNAIYFGNSLLSPSPNGRIRIPKYGHIEQYTMFAGTWAHPMGAFSYSYSNTDNLQCGRYCSIGNSLKLFGERHPLESVTTSNITYCFRKDWNKPTFLRAHADLMGNRWTPPPPIGDPHAQDPKFGHDVWICDNVTLARGIVIGTGAVVGAGSIVTKNVAPYTIVAGNPARPKRKRFADEICDKLLASEWWLLHPSVLFELRSDQPEVFLEQIENAKGTLPLSPVRTFSWRDIVDAVE